MNIYITNISKKKLVPVDEETVVTLLQRVAEEEDWDGDISLAVVDDAAISELNARFSGKKGPTDVLAFPYDPQEDGLCGEIVVSEETAVRAAGEYHEPVERELLRYCVHGLLHLCGYKDGTADDRQTMKRREEECLPPL